MRCCCVAIDYLVSKKRPYFVYYYYTLTQDCHKRKDQFIAIRMVPALSIFDRVLPSRELSEVNYVLIVQGFAGCLTKQFPASACA